MNGIMMLDSQSPAYPHSNTETHTRQHKKGQFLAGLLVVLVLLLFLVYFVFVYVAWTTPNESDTYDTNTKRHHHHRSPYPPRPPPSHPHPHPPHNPCSSAVSESQGGSDKAWGFAPYGGVTCQTGPRGIPGCPFQINSRGIINDAFFVSHASQPWILFGSANSGCVYYHYVTEDQRTTHPIVSLDTDLSGHLISYQLSMDQWMDVGLLRGDPGEDGKDGADGSTSTGGSVSGPIPIDLQVSILDDGTLEDLVATEDVFQNCAGTVVTVLIGQDQRSDLEQPAYVSSYGDLTGQLLLYICDSQRWVLAGGASNTQSATLAFRGEWSALETYNFQDVVTVGRSSFVLNNQNPVTGGASPDTMILSPNADWRPLAIGGVDGSNGLDAKTFQIRGEFDAKETYELLDMVSWHGASYLANTTISNGCDPSQCPSNWQLVADQGIGGANGEPFHISAIQDVNDTFFSSFVTPSECTGFWYMVVQQDLRSNLTLPLNLSLTSLANHLLQYDCQNATWTKISPFIPTNGTNGTNGLSLTHIGTWSAATTYALNDVVTWNGSSFVSKTSNNLNHTPDPLSNTTYWGIMSLMGLQGNPAAAIVDYTFAGLGAGTGVLSPSLLTNSVNVLAPWTISVGTGLHNNGSGGAGTGALNLSTGFYTVPATDTYDVKISVKLPGTIAVGVLSELTVELRQRVGASVSKTNDPILLSARPRNVTVLSGLVTLQISNDALVLVGTPQLTSGQVLYVSATNNGGVPISPTLSSVSSESNWSIRRTGTSS